MKTSRKLVVSKYTEEDDAEAEETSTLITRMDKIKQAEATKTILDLSSGLLSEVLYDADVSLQDLVVEDPKEAIARKQVEDRELVQKLTEDLKGKKFVESSILVTSSMKIKKEDGGPDDGVSA